MQIVSIIGLITSLLIVGLVCADDVHQGYSTDIDIGLQYILPTEGFKVVQEVEYENQGTGDLLIDSFTITQIGTANSGSSYTSWFEAVEIWEDGGNGYYDRGIDRLADDTLIDSIEDPPDDIDGRFGMNNDTACLVVPQDSSKKVFVTVDVYDGIACNDSIIVELSAEDLVSSSPIKWATGEGVETATSSTNIFAKSCHTSRRIVDTNDNGIADQIIWNHFYPIGPATKLDHNISEASTIEKFTVEYNENEVGILGIELYETNYENRASFVLLLDEEDPDLQVDTTSVDFSCSYDSTGEELSFENAIGQSVPVWPFPLFPIWDGVGPVVLSLTVSDEMITNEDVGDTFEVVLTFSESMYTESFPVLDFDATVHEGSSQMLIFDSQNWIDEETCQIDYTIADEHLYAGNIDVICTTEGVYDVDAYGDAENQMNAAYTKTDLFTIDTKAPDISGFPSDTLTPEEEYTVRVDVTDESDIQTVILDYNFGSSWNTKTMNNNPSSDEYFAVVTPPADATSMSYKITAYDMYDNGDETSEKELTVGGDEDDDSEEKSDDDDLEGDDENDDEEIDDDAEKQDSDDDGYDDDMEEAYGTNTTDESEMPEDTDDDGIPNDDSDDGNYTGDLDDDDDGLSDDIEKSLGSDSKNNSDVISVEELEGYLVDTDDDGSSDRFYVPSDETSTTVTKDDDGNYDIDVNGDGTTDYTYNVTTKSIEVHGETDTTDSTPGFSAGFILFSLGMILLMLFYRRKY